MSLKITESFQIIELIEVLNASEQKIDDLQQKLKRCYERIELLESENQELKIDKIRLISEKEIAEEKLLSAIQDVASLKSTIAKHEPKCEEIEITEISIQDVNRVAKAVETLEHDLRDANSENKRLSDDIKTYKEKNQKLLSELVQEKGLRIGGRVVIKGGLGYILDETCKYAEKDYYIGMKIGAPLGPVGKAVGGAVGAIYGGITAGVYSLFA